MSRSHSFDPIAYTITKLHEDPESEPDAPRMRPWRKAVIAAALATSPAPVAATVATGSAGWTAAVLVADVAAVLGAVVSHAHAEATMVEESEPAVEVSWEDYDGVIVRSTAEAA